MAINQELIDEYLNLLIIQYRSLPNASAEIGSKVARYSRVYEFFNSFFDAFDVDVAIGRQLDILGRIVGINRIVPFSAAKTYFGFDGTDNSATFGQAPFFDGIADSGYTDTELSDTQMRFSIKVKAAKNAASPYMVSDDRLSIQDVIRSAFDNMAYVVDNKDMTLTLYVDSSVSFDDVTLIRQLNLLPKPMGVGYKSILQANFESFFGFADNPNAKGFGEGSFADGIGF